MRVGLGSAGGSILLEVVLATVLVGLIVAPLASALAGTVDEARAVRQRAAADGRTGPSTGASGNWEWGPRVVAAWWRPGPVLHVRVSGDTGEYSPGVRSFGLWADGWLIAEETVDPSEAANGTAVMGETGIGPTLWTGLADNELVIRARAAGGAWGPPWRLAVPPAAGLSPVPGPALPSMGQEPALVAHRPAVGSSSLAVSWTPGALASHPFGLLFVVSEGASGWGGATLDERTQWWWMEEGRSVDLYF
jgi:hypothetical protein